MVPALEPIPTCAMSDVLASGQMHEILHLGPLDRVTGSVGAENRIEGVIQVGFQIVADGFHHGILILAGTILTEDTGEMSAPMTVDIDLHGIITHLRNRGFLLPVDRLPIGPWILERALHLVDIGHGPA